MVLCAYDHSRNYADFHMCKPVLSRTILGDCVGFEQQLALQPDVSVGLVLDCKLNFAMCFLMPILHHKHFEWHATVLQQLPTSWICVLWWAGLCVVVPSVCWSWWSFLLFFMPKVVILSKQFNSLLLIELPSEVISRGILKYLKLLFVPLKLFTILN